MWEEFSSCFLKISQSEEDKMSTCLAGNDEILQGKSKTFSRKTAIDVSSVTGKEWILRCRWWQTRHFSLSILALELEAGDLLLQNPPDAILSSVAQSVALGVYGHFHIGNPLSVAYYLMQHHLGLMDLSNSNFSGHAPASIGDLEHLLTL
ncbi:hypothetical protein AgCh_005512 [Apium graveolens]